MHSDPALRQAGLALLEKIHGPEAADLLQRGLKICPDFATATIEWALAGIMARPGLDLLTREFWLIAACTTIGHVTPQLRAHIAAARNLGATNEQIVEVIFQMMFYAGGAAVRNALGVAEEVLLRPTEVGSK